MSKQSTPKKQNPETDETQRAGLGKVIYSTGEPAGADVPSEETVDKAEVQEASEESFPASDAPGYAGGSGTEST